MNAWTLPVCVTVGGQPRAVYTDYRDILYLLNWLDGPRGAALSQATPCRRNSSAL